MCDKYKITAEFFFCILTDQMLLLRLQIVWITELSVIFFSHALFCLIETDRRNLAYIRKLDLQNI